LKGVNNFWLLLSFSLHSLGLLISAVRWQILIKVRVTTRLWAFWPSPVLSALFSTTFGIIVLFLFAFAASLSRLDTAAYRDEALSGKVKGLLGSAASAVLRCNDCIDYHLSQCVEAGYADAELHDALNVGLIVGGSIVIPHLRHACETIALLHQGKP
jgi:AhpD family alkylhydroperoxidase